MDNEIVARVSFLEKLNKTIAMITASDDYQRYVKAKRHRAFMKSFTGDIFKRARNPYLSVKAPKARWCIRCEEPLKIKSKLGMCSSCTRIFIWERYRSCDLTIDYVARELNVCSGTVHKYLQNKNGLVALQ